MALSKPTGATTVSCRSYVAVTLPLLCIAAVMSIEERRFDNNWRAKPAKLKTAPAGLTAAALGGLNDGQQADVRKVTPGFDFKKDVLAVEHLRVLSLTSKQLDKIGLTEDDERRKAGLDEKSIVAFRTTAAGLDDAVVTGLELILYPNENQKKKPPHYAVRINTNKKNLPQIFTDYGDNEKDNNMYKFVTLGSEPNFVVASVTKVLVKKKTIKDFNEHVQKNTHLTEVYGQDNCLSYAGQLLIYALGECGVDGLDLLDVRAQLCEHYGTDNVVFFLKDAVRKNKGWFATGPGWSKNDFVARVGRQIRTPSGDDDCLL